MTLGRERNAGGRPDADQRIGAAISAIAETQGDDHVMEPMAHAARLEKQAPALASLLKSSVVQTLARQYTWNDQEAREAQQRFKKMARQARWAVLLTICCGAAVLITGPINEALKIDVGRPILIALGTAGIILGGLGTMWISNIRRGELLERWMNTRAVAETRRIQYFNSIMRAAPSDSLPTEVPLPLLKLEYFRRYQLDVQLAYYRSRSSHHRRRADRTLRLSGGAVALGAIATGLGGYLGTLWGPLASLAALGVAGSGLAAFASTREAVNQDRRNAERYRRTLEVLEQIRAKLDDVRNS